MTSLFLAHYENLQDKLAQLRDARDALDALREEHYEQKRREEEEANRLRQIAMVRPRPHVPLYLLHVNIFYTPLICILGAKVGGFAAEEARVFGVPATVALAADARAGTRDDDETRTGTTHG